ncbi:HEXXH motif-containing putative peptide modification protein [Catellatospora sp. NPDC049133]|uniref:aKG-HExxH-type peptide beta-hydroxylase n=1 Tax=Catellatospora sp. NPDC049133 TaxID=3155499 RepID=UPI0034102748
MTIVEKEFGGFPFVDPGFAPTRLLTAVACCRWQRTNPGSVPAGSELSAVLTPERALTIRRLDLSLDLPFGQLSDERQVQIAQTRAYVGTLLPDWRPLLDVPLTFHQLRHSQAISSSNFAWPQHIFLAAAAFAAPTTLAEQIVHETCHQWLYFIEEMWPLQEDNGPRFTLPSGTGGRSASELLGASHVVVCLHRLWSAMPADAELRARRLAHLRAYGAGCEALMRGAREAFTPVGQALASRLIEEIEAI